jgi:hypothetical protein
VQAGRHSLAFASFTSALSKGHSPALAHLSWLLLFGGAGVPPNRDRACMLVRAREFASCRHCQGCLSCCYAEGWGANKNLKRALALAQKSAAAGSAFGLYMMGWLHERGGGGVAVVNRPLALAFYKQAAALGLAAAQNNAGFMCAHGDGVPLDACEAVRFYSLAAAQGDSDAQCAALLPVWRVSCPVCRVICDTWRVIASPACPCNIPARYNLACMLETGRGAPRDVTGSLQLYATRFPRCIFVTFWPGTTRQPSAATATRCTTSLTCTITA